jgi:DNA topoisomerase-1
MSILIVESPAKCKKIQSFLDNSYIVKSSVGHIRTLDTKWANTDVKIEENFIPPFVTIKGKEDVIKNLKNYSKDRKIILAADDDREGEAIAWHCGDILKTNFNSNNRIIFREITKSAILNALKNPTKVNMNEVNAQKARSVIDLLIGYKLSPCLWANITTKEKGLSAGRVQSALLKLLYDREKEIKEYEPEYTFDIQGKFKDLKEKSEFIFKSSCEDEPDEDYIKDLFKKFSEDRLFKVIDNKINEEKKYPDKPFITSSLQQSAQKSCNFNVKKTMDIAQKLYENGLITYMRTDSTIVSEDFQRLLNDKITNEYGQEYYNCPLVKKVKGSQEAHECIRPTKLNNEIDEEKFSKDEIKLYNLIYDRTIKSHMKPALYNVNSIKLCNSNTNEIGYFTSKQKELKFKGFLEYKRDNNKEEEKENKIVEFKNEYKLLECSCTDKASQPPEPYNESSIVKLLENTGIGRPSTYASIISTLYNRNYTLTKTIKLDDYTEDIIHLDKKNNITEKVNKVKGKTMKNKIVVTELGNKVLNYLNEKFYDIIHKDFTAGVETDLDKISNGELIWTDIINKVYNSFLPMVLREIRNKPQKSNNILGEYKGKEVKIGSGQYGPYILYNKKFTNVDKYLKSKKKTLDELTIEDCEIILKYPIKINKDIQIMLGPYGTYLKYNNKNYKIKQNIEYTEEYCLSIINN